MERNEALSRLRRTGVIAVLRAPSADAVVQVVEALVAGGVTGIEVTYSTPNAALAIQRVAAEYGDSVYLGAGTVLTEPDARDAVEAGAEFLVSPGVDATLAPVLTGLGVPVMLGALTPSEVMAAIAHGATAVKIFPASLVGPSYLTALRGPFPQAPLMPTGGVNAGNLRLWFAAGALAVGAGGDLVPRRLLAAADWDGITSIAREFRDAFERVNEEVGHE